MSNPRDLHSVVFSSIKEVGITFNQGSYLELQNPPNLLEQAARTKISLYFNVSRTEYGRAFILYLGNEVDTYTKMPFTSTDDYLAVEVTESGHVKLIIDMGAATPFRLESNSPIVYGQWHQLIIDRRGHYVTMIVKSEQGPGEVEMDVKENQPLPRKDAFDRPVGGVFNLHKDYSRLFVGGFPTENAKIQESVRETFMQGQIEGLMLGDQAVGLWNYKDAQEIQGAPGRNKFRKMAETSVKLNGQGYIPVALEEYAPVNADFVVKIKFKMASGNGMVLLMGDPVDQDFVCIELHNKVVVFSFDLGDGTVSIESPETYELNVWHTVEISRVGRVGKLTVNGQLLGEASSSGEMDMLSVVGPLYVGGYPGTPPYQAVRPINFTGCVEEVYIGPDKVDVTASEDARGTSPGCSSEAATLATFPAATPGYAQLDSQEFGGYIEITFMFRTSQRRGLMMYLVDSPTQFNYASVAVFDGHVHLHVFPRHKLVTGQANNKAVKYNDNQWHTVSFVLSKTSVLLTVDDYDAARIDVEDESEMLLLESRYNVFMGGVPEDVSFVADAAPTKAPFVGCVRDVLIETAVTDMNNIPYHTGIELGQCSSVDASEAATDTDDADTAQQLPPEAPVDANEIEDDVEEEEEEDSWTLEPTAEEEEAASQTYGECRLPTTPAIDTDVRRNSGLRFGAKSDTFLEFNRKLKVRKRSEFAIEFKTTETDGIIFYIANERNVDFIALFIKDGKLVYGFNCGSGAAFTQSEDAYNDGQWHKAVFSRVGSEGNLKVDGNLVGELDAFGNTKNIEVENTFYLGNVRAELLELEIVQRNLQNVLTGFVGCLRELRLRGKAIGRWQNNHKNGVIPCSEKVEPGYFFGPNGGSLMAFRKFRVGLDFDVTMQIKPRNISGVLLAIQGRRDYLALQMIDGTLTFTVNNGREPITAVFKPDNSFSFCDGRWHEVHGKTMTTYYSSRAFFLDEKHE